MTTTRVGPILVPGEKSDALIAAIREADPAVRVEDQGGYLRVSCPDVCRVSRATIEAHLGAAFALPSDLEEIMPSFQGKLELSESQVVWRWRA